MTVEELNLETEGSNRDTSPSEEATGDGFGLTLGPLGAEMARRLQVPPGTRGVLVTDIDTAGPAARSGVRPGDVILQVNRRPVEAVAEAHRALQAIKPGGYGVPALVEAGPGDLRHRHQGVAGPLRLIVMEPGCRTLIVNRIRLSAMLSSTLCFMSLFSARQTVDSLHGRHILKQFLHLEFISAPNALRRQNQLYFPSHFCRRLKSSRSLKDKISERKRQIG